MPFCFQCGGKFNTFEDLTDHFNEAHPELVKKPDPTRTVECEMCGKTVTRKLLEEHMARVHSFDIQRCKICDSFQRNSRKASHHIIKSHNEVYL
jgi:uncharacterized C2H2 Zn-finger protein